MAPITEKSVQMRFLFCHLLGFSCREGSEAVHYTAIREVPAAVQLQTLPCYWENVKAFIVGEASACISLSLYNEIRELLSLPEVAAAVAAAVSH